ncbi:MAG: GT4 family glycosyltransferase PelF [Nitrospinaceae bacterium]
MNPNPSQADVCLVLEGTYPYIAGGVSNWSHELIQALPELKFHLLAIVPPNADLSPRYRLPGNVEGITHLVLQQLPLGRSRISQAKKWFADLEEPLMRLESHGTLPHLARIIELLAPLRKTLGRKVLLDSPEAWDLLLSMYQADFPGSSFIDYFWSWRMLVGGLYSALLPDLPRARVYHAVSTGYAGLLAARASLETGRPALLTEHGIYTNERRIEISMSQWLYEKPLGRLSVDKLSKDLKDLWIDTFNNYSRICYEACSKIITIFEGNQKFQTEDGADPGKLDLIPNGIDYAKFSKIQRKKSARPTIALIGRVVPIKDIITFIRACSILQKKVPDLQAYIMGPMDEDEVYFKECQETINYLGLQNTISFTGRVKLEDKLGGIDVIVLTSISEGQPLVILEAGAVGIPSVATNVGACSELILGNALESPSLGPAGSVTPLSNPAATASAIAQLLTDEGWYRQCSDTCRERVRLYYNKGDLTDRYRELYQNYLRAPELSQAVEV